MHDVLMQHKWFLFDVLSWFLCVCPPPTFLLVQQHHLAALCFVFQICLKGKVHIFKYLNIQACRLDKKPDTLDLPSLGKRCLPQPLTDRYHDLLFYSLTLDVPTPASFILVRA